MNIQIKSWFSGSVLFELDCEENSIKVTVEAAVKAGVSLNYANLVNASLDGANLVGASLVGASLVNASLAGANLVGARLAGANLVGANLVGANINGEKVSINPLSIVGLSWWVFITDKYMRIGCKLHLHTEWAAFGNAEISRMDSLASEFWAEHKGMLLAICDAHAKRAAAKSE